MSNDPPAEDRSVRGNTIRPHRVESKEAAVESPPQNETDIVRNKELEKKADLDNGTIKSSQFPDVSPFAVIGRMVLGDDQTIPTDSITQVALSDFSVESDAVEVDVIENNFKILKQGTYYIEASYTWNPSSNWTTGDAVTNYIYDDGSPLVQDNKVKTSTEVESFTISSTAQLDDGNVIDLRVEQYSGSNQVVSGQNFREDTRMSVSRIGKLDN